MVCAAMLARAYVRTPSRLLLWSSACFVGLAINNVLLFVDRVVVPERDLTLYRDVSGLAALSVLLFGLIWESK